jgi:hypothetical protein
MMNDLRWIVVSRLILFILRIVPKDQGGLDLIRMLGSWSVREFDRAPAHIKAKLGRGESKRALYSPYCLWPMSDAPCTYSGGQDKTVQTCRAMFDNRLNFNDFTFVPPSDVDI